MQLRKTIFWCHLLAGVIAGVIILIMSVTGALLAFRPQIVEFANRHARAVQPAERELRRLSVEALLAKAREAKPDSRIMGVTLQSDPSAAAEVLFGLGGGVGELQLNPYTGQILEGSKWVQDFFRVVSDWHRWLGARSSNRAAGRAVTGICNAVLLVLAVSGPYLWWRKKMTAFKFGLRGYARDWNWHNVTGVWCSLVLAMITTTGVIMSYQWANNLLYALTGSEAPPPPPALAEFERLQPLVPRNLNQLWTRAEQQAPGWRTISVRLPPVSDAPAIFSIREGGGWNIMVRSQVMLDPATAEVVRWEPYASLSLGRKLRLWARFLHTGEAGGLPGQTVACLASLGGGLLAWTGLALAGRRFYAWQVRIGCRNPVPICNVQAERYSAASQSVDTVPSGQFNS